MNNFGKKILTVVAPTVATTVVAPGRVVYR